MSSVEFYKHDSYRALMGTARPEVGSRGSFQGGSNDQMSSMRIRLDPGHRFTLHKHHGFRGSSHTWYGDADVNKWELQGYDLHDEASSWEFRDVNGNRLNSREQIIR